MSTAARFADARLALAYLLGGHARVTLVSKKTQARYTYRVNISKDKRRFYVAVLTGADNGSAYEFIGTIFPDVDVPGEGARFAYAQKSLLAPNAASVVAFAWTFPKLARGVMPETLEVWHEGVCGRCGRALTVPASIESGLGPECQKKTMRSYYEFGQLAEFEADLKGDLRK
jgi:Family of unknown function (DUF6011)